MVHALISFILILMIYKLPLWSIVVFLVGAAVSRGAVKAFREIIKV